MKTSHIDHQRTVPIRATRSYQLALVLCLSLLAIRCGGGSPPPANSDAKAITSFSIANPAASGVIDENAKTITINLPRETDVTALVATFTTNGVSVQVGSTAQVSGVTPNNFSRPVDYTVTAADGTSVTYAVNVRVAGLTLSHCIERPSDCTWTGRATSTSGPSSITADPVTFQFDHADGDRVTFKPVSGTAVEAQPPCTIDPTQQITVADSAGNLDPGDRLQSETSDLLYYRRNPVVWIRYLWSTQELWRTGGPWCGRRCAPRPRHRQRRWQDH